MNDSSKQQTENEDDSINCGRPWLMKNYKREKKNG